MVPGNEVLPNLRQPAGKTLRPYQSPVPHGRKERRELTALAAPAVPLPPLPSLPLSTHFAKTVSRRGEVSELREGHFTSLKSRTAVTPLAAESDIPLFNLVLLHRLSLGHEPVLAVLALFLVGSGIPQPPPPPQTS